MSDRWLVTLVNATFNSSDHATKEDALVAAHKYINTYPYGKVYVSKIATIIEGKIIVVETNTEGKSSVYLAEEPQTKETVAEPSMQEIMASIRRIINGAD